MPQVEPEDLQSVPPLPEVALSGIASSRVTRKTCRHDQVRAGSEELEAGLIPDLDPATGQQCHSSTQVRQLTSLAVVELGAGGTHLVVEVMENSVLLLAYIAVLRLDRLPGGPLFFVLLLEAPRRKQHPAREYPLAAH